MSFGYIHAPRHGRDGAALRTGAKVPIRGEVGFFLQIAKKDRHIALKDNIGLCATVSTEAGVTVIARDNVYQVIVVSLAAITAKRAVEDAQCGSGWRGATWCIILPAAAWSQ